MVKNNHAEPYHWFHGVNDDGVELEIFSLLNGPRRDILRKANLVSYIEPELPPYSLVTSQISGPIPAILRGDFSLLAKNYNFVSVGRSRILGRVAQLIRIESKDAHKFGHWLWLDQESGLLLELALVTGKGQLLEQIQFTNLEISKQLVEGLKQLDVTELPQVIDIPENAALQEMAWRVKWLPAGFVRIKTNRHKITANKQPVEFMLFNDGLVDVSVYINASKMSPRPAEYVMDGATVVLNQIFDGYEVSVVGKVPAKTAKTIAKSVVLLTNK